MSETIEIQSEHPERGVLTLQVEFELESELDPYGTGDSPRRASVELITVMHHKEDFYFQLTDAMEDAIIKQIAERDFL
jgi:hypothetical protein